MREYLKVKLLSLVAETDIIRQREERYKDLIYIREWDGFPADTERKILAGLISHRMKIVRPEIRATHIAYGALKGKTLIDIEMYPSKIPTIILKKAARMFVKYGEYDLQKGVNEFTLWVAASILEEVFTNNLYGEVNDAEQVDKTMEFLNKIRNDPKYIYTR